MSNKKPILFQWVSAGIASISMIGSGVGIGVVFVASIVCVDYQWPVFAAFFSEFEFRILICLTIILWITYFQYTFRMNKIWFFILIFVCAILVGLIIYVTYEFAVFILLVLRIF